MTEKLDKEEEVCYGKLARTVRKIRHILKLGHGEVTVKVKNGTIHRVLSTEDELMDK